MSRFLRVAVCSGVLLLSGCTTEAVPPAPPAPSERCADPTRIAYADRISQSQLEEIRKVLRWLGAGDAELIPMKGESPHILNRGEVAQAMEREYPPGLRSERTVGTVETLLLIGESGRVVIALVSESSGHRALDEAAVRVARSILFTVPRTDGTPVCYWQPMPIIFRSR